jgi:hypothetical protein
LNNLAPTGKLTQFPPILAFQSAVDATVSTSALVDGLFSLLPNGGHELVIFDVNRMSEVEQILWEDPWGGIEALFRQPRLPFGMSLVTNQDEKSRSVVLYYKEPEGSAIVKRDIKMSWPKGLYSLSHVSLPIPPNDPLYGVQEDQQRSPLQLGKLALRGERGVLQIPASEMLRLRWNPFYPYLEQRIVEFVGLEEGVDVAAVSSSRVRERWSRRGKNR